MSWLNSSEGKRDRLEASAQLREGAPRDPALEDPAVEEALKNFKLSVHAWSDAAYVQPRVTAQIVRRRSWRLAAGWALAALLMAGGISGGVFERHQKVEKAKIAAAARLAEQQKALHAQQAMDEKDLLASVDSEVSHEVPSAMEPLAQLMNESTK